MSRPKKNLINLSIDADLLSAIKAQANARGVEKVSDYIQEWLKNLGFDKDDIKRVILQIPDSAFNSKEALELWLNKRNDEIIRHYFKEEINA